MVEAERCLEPWLLAHFRAQLFFHTAALIFKRCAKVHSLFLVFVISTNLNSFSQCSGSMTFGVDADPDPRILASDKWIRIREAQKHVDLVDLDPALDPDPEH